MTTCTPVYGLTYQSCADRPCDAPAAWCQFAANVETQLDALDTIVDRTVDTIPMFQVSISAPITFPTSDRTVFWDTVNVDTDDMVDLASDNASIKITRMGRWFFWFRVSTNGNTALQANIPVQVANTPTLGTPGSMIITQDFQDNGTNYPAYINGSGFYRYPALGNRVLLSVNTAATGVLTASFGGYWVGDL